MCRANERFVLSERISSCGDVFNVTAQCNNDGDTQLLMPKIVLVRLFSLPQMAPMRALALVIKVQDIVALFLRYLLISNYETDKGPP